MLSVLVINSTCKGKINSEPGKTFLLRVRVLLFTFKTILKSTLEILTSSPKDLSNSNFDSIAYEALNALAPEILASRYERPPSTRSKLKGLLEYGLKI